VSGLSGVVPRLTQKHRASRIDEVQALANETEVTALLAKQSGLSPVGSPIVRGSKVSPAEPGAFF